MEMKSYILELKSARIIQDRKEKIIQCLATSGFLNTFIKL